jgi:hypothetical protein
LNIIQSSKKNRNQKGVAILFVVLLVGILLSMVLTLSSIFAPKIRASFDVNSSAGAMFASESAIEWCLYVNRQSPPEPTPAPPVMDNGAIYVNAITNVAPIPSDCLSPSIKIIGTYRSVSRALDVTF